MTVIFRPVPTQIACVGSLMQYAEDGEMKVGIPYFAKGCLCSFYFTNPILLPKTQLISWGFFLFCCCLYFPPTWRVNITVLSAVIKVFLVQSSVWASLAPVQSSPVYGLCSSLQLGCFGQVSNMYFFSRGRGRILPGFLECCGWEVKMCSWNG